MKIASGNYYTLITGASSGIGKALSEECAHRKMNLYLISLPDSGLEAFAEELRANNGVLVHLLAIDLIREDAPRRVFEHARSLNININMLINNAGIGHLGDFKSQDSKIIDEIISLNIRTTTQLTRLFINELILLPESYILNMSSFIAFVPAPFKSVYGASKSYLLFFSRSLRLELKKYNVKVSSLHPSGVATNPRIISDMKNRPFYARATTLTGEQVAKYAMDNLMQGRDSIIPGFFTRTFFRIGFILPYGLMLNMMYRLFCRKQSTVQIV
jgi:uncharacterized protein